MGLSTLHPSPSHLLVAAEASRVGAGTPLIRKVSIGQEGEMTRSPLYNEEG